ncbi:MULTISPECIES: NAD(P)H-binding protein [unclassified Shouchella]|uniref:NAD(P)H-binding protein n=1 Tax=unclassified Shouchella TaxID=2893065 RepID=UPI0039A22CD0
MKPYAVAKNMSDHYIEKSDLNYSIVRPGPMNNDGPISKIELHQTTRKDHSNYKRRCCQCSCQYVR